MSVRSTYIVTYDIRDDKRLRAVFKEMRNWGDHLQYSVFECQLTPTDLLTLREQLRELVHMDLDQILFFNLGPADGRGDRAIEALGQPYQPFDAPCLIV